MTKKTSKELADELCNALDEKRILEPDQLTVEAAAVRLVAQDARIAELTENLETERMRLAACGVVAMANTPESAAKFRQMDDKYRSASLNDVIRCVDEEMKLRNKVAELTKDAEPVAWGDEHLKMLNFLYGAGEFDGVWFEEKHPIERGAFWWRKHLRRLFNTPPAPEHEKAGHA